MRGRGEEGERGDMECIREGGTEGREVWEEESKGIEVKEDSSDKESEVCVTVCVYVYGRPYIVCVHVCVHA